MEIRIYKDQKGNLPLTGWLGKLRDRRAREIIHNRIDRLRLDNLGDSRSLGNGLFEIRIHYGPGYRVYFGQSGKNIILLLCGGNKSTQQQDVNLARKYWLDYRRS